MIFGAALPRNWWPPKRLPTAISRRKTINSNHDNPLALFAISRSGTANTTGRAVAKPSRAAFAGAVLPSSDPAKRLVWLAEAAKWERETEAEIASHFEACKDIIGAAIADIAISIRGRFAGASHVSEIDGTPRSVIHRPRDRVDAGIGTGHKTPCFGYACAAMVGLNRHRVERMSAPG